MVSGSLNDWKYSDISDKMLSNKNYDSTLHLLNTYYKLGPVLEYILT